MFSRESDKIITIRFCEKLKNEEIELQLLLSEVVKSLKSLMTTSCV